MTESTQHRTPAELVREFHETYGQPIRTVASVDVPERKMRVALVVEEYEEYKEAEETDDFIEIADALGDIVYVAVGAFLTHGLNPEDYSQSWIFDPGVTHPQVPTLDIPVRREWVARMKSQVDLYVKAEAEGNINDLGNALASIVNVAYEAAAAHGIDLDVILAEIQRSNMSKLGEDGKPIYREDGKVLKGKNFFPPNISAILSSLGWQGSPVA